MTRISALGGHGFFVSWPRGHKIIEKTEVGLDTRLVHETTEGESLKKSGFLSAMRWKGGVNFTIKHRGGYRPKTKYGAIVDAEHMANAIDDGFVCFLTRFLG